MGTGSGELLVTGLVGRKRKSGDTGNRTGRGDDVPTQPTAKRAAWVSAVSFSELTPQQQGSPACIGQDSTSEAGNLPEATLIRGALRALTAVSVAPKSVMKARSSKEVILVESIAGY